MNLDEISLKKDIQNTNNPAEILKKYGWNVLGTPGEQGAVAQHPTKPYVLKLFRPDLRYLKFLKFVEENSNNQHLPKINRNVKTIPGTNLSYVRMERLYPISELALWNKYKVYMIYLSLLAIKNDLSISQSAEDATWKSLTDKHLYEPVLRKVKFDDIWYAYQSKPPFSWIDICRKLIDFADSNGIDFLDIHSHNLMSRDNTLVITDPF